MRLYQMELYKLFHKKIVWLSGAVMIVWLVLYFLMESVGSEHTTVEGHTYYGYEAIQKDYMITQKYNGVLNDNLVKEVIAAYGLPTEVEENVGFKNMNYLTEFITKNLTNGKIIDWDDYQLPTTIYSISDTDFSYFASNGNLPFSYAKGWVKFYEFCNMGLVMIFVWLIIAIAPIFCEEKQQNMYPLIFSAELGKSKDVSAKLFAAFSLAVGVYAAFMVCSVLIFQKVFHIFPSNMQVGVVLNVSGYQSIAYKGMLDFFAFSACFFALAVMMVTAVGSYVSSLTKTVFTSVLISLLIFVLPIVLQITVRGGLVYFFTSGQPFLMVNYQCLIETWSIHIVHIVIAFVIIGAGVIHGSKKWRKIERS